MNPIKPHDYLRESPIKLYAVRALRWSIGAPYSGIHYRIGKTALPAMHAASSQVQELIERPINCGYHAQHIRLKVGLGVMDAVVLSKEGNTRWAAMAQGNGETLGSADSRASFLNELGANAIVMGYHGLTNVQDAITGFRQILLYAEKQTEGNDKREVMTFGHSMGGGVVREALKQHTFQKGIDYAAVTSNSYTTCGKVVGRMKRYGVVQQPEGNACVESVEHLYENDEAMEEPGLGKRVRVNIVGSVVYAAMKVFGWNVGSVGVSEKLHREGVHEHIVQATRDNVISQGARLGEKKHPSAALWTATTGHNDPLDLTPVAQRIEEQFAEKRVRLVVKKRSYCEVALFGIAFFLAVGAIVAGGLNGRFHYIPGALPKGWKMGLVIGGGVGFATVTLIIYQKTKVYVRSESEKEASAH